MHRSLPSLHTRAEQDTHLKYIDLPCSSAMAYLQDVCRPFLNQQDEEASGFKARGSQASGVSSGTSASIFEAAPAAEFLDGVPDNPLPVIEPLPAADVADMIDELLPCDLPRQGVENSGFYAGGRDNRQTQRHARISRRGTQTACVPNYSDSVPYEPHELQGSPNQPFNDQYQYMQQLLDIAPLSHSFLSHALDPLHPHSRIFSTIAPATVLAPPTQYSAASAVTAPPAVNSVVFDPSRSNNNSNILGARTSGRGTRTACLLNRFESLPYEPYQLQGSPNQPLNDQNQHMPQAHGIAPLTHSFPSCALDPLHPQFRIAQTVAPAPLTQSSAASGVTVPAVNPVVHDQSRSNSTSTIQRTRTTASAGARGRGRGKQQPGGRKSGNSKHAAGVSANYASTSAVPARKSRTEGVLRQVMSRRQDHNIHERERRKSTNQLYDTMRSLIPAFQSPDPEKKIKIDKVAIVEEMYKYIVSSKDELKMLETKLEQHKIGDEQPPTHGSTNMSMPRLTCVDHTGDPAALTAITTTPSLGSESCQNSFLGTNVSFHVVNRTCLVTISASRNLKGLSALVIETLEIYHVQIACIAVFVCDETRSQSLQCKIDPNLEMQWGDVHSGVQRVVNNFIASASSSDAHSA